MNLNFLHNNENKYKMIETEIDIITGGSAMLNFDENTEQCSVPAMVVLAAAGLNCVPCTTLQKYKLYCEMLCAPDTFLVHVAC